MSDLETFGFPQIALQAVRERGGWTARPSARSRGRNPVKREFGAWECLQHVLAPPMGRPLQRVTRRKHLQPQEYDMTPEQTLLAQHTLDAVRVILGLDTLYAGERTNGVRVPRRRVNKKKRCEPSPSL